MGISGEAREATRPRPWARSPLDGTWWSKPAVTHRPLHALQREGVGTVSPRGSVHVILAAHKETLVSGPLRTRRENRNFNPLWRRTRRDWNPAPSLVLTDSSVGN